MEKNDKICILGRRGMLGSAIWSQLETEGYTNLIGVDRAGVDLCNQAQTEAFFSSEKPNHVFFTAAVAAGIEYKRTHPADMLLKNTQMIVNVMNSAAEHGCRKLLNVSSALLYSKSAAIPLMEDSLTHTDFNEVDTPYALAKAVGVQLASYYASQYGMEFFTAVPCNFFGAYAPFEGDRAGVVPALIARMYQAKVEHASAVSIWGSGKACRELLNSRDVASACVFLMTHPVEYPVINIGRGCEYAISEVAETIREVVGYKGALHFDRTKPEGRLHMQLDTGRIRGMGWTPALNLRESIADAYDYYLTTLG